MIKNAKHNLGSEFCWDTRMTPCNDDGARLFVLRAARRGLVHEAAVPAHDGPALPNADHLLRADRDDRHAPARADLNPPINPPILQPLLPFQPNLFSTSHPSSQRVQSSVLTLPCTQILTRVGYED